jgi:hypothetical protein
MEGPPTRRIHSVFSVFAARAGLNEQTTIKRERKIR